MKRLPVQNLISRSHSVITAIALLTIAAGIVGCQQPESQLVDMFNKKLEEKDAIISALRTSEITLQNQVGELNGRLAEVKTELDSARTRSLTLDTQKLADELAPLLAKQIQPQAVRPTVNNSNPPGPLPMTPGKPVVKKPGPGGDVQRFQVDF